jgi:hypothetical protein
MPTLKLIISIEIGISISKSPTTGRNTIFSALIFWQLFYQEKSCVEGKR